MSVTIPVEQLSETIEKELTLYHENVIKGMKKEAKKSMSKLVKETKATAPVGRRKQHYRDNISSKKKFENNNSVIHVWYVKGSDYRLSHLLENGHALKRGGRVKGTHFIKKASVPVLEEYERKVKEVCEGG